jgi:hypothetical protein
MLMNKEILYSLGLVVMFHAGGAFAASNNPPLPVVSVVASDPNASEDGPDTGAFAVSRTGATTNQLMVYYSLRGTAYNGIDYKMLPGFVTIPAGAASAPVTVTPLLDVDFGTQTTDTVVLQLIDLIDTPVEHPGRPDIAAHYLVGYPSNAVVTITESTNAPTLPVVTVSATDANASEDGPDPGTFTFMRKGSTNDQLTVYYSLGGTARNGTDYQRVPDSVTIPAGSNATTVTITPLPDVDTTAETNETVVLQLRPLGDLRPGRFSLYTLGYPSNAVVTIAESTNPPPQAPVVTVLATDPKASEDGPDTGTFAVTRTGSTNNQLTVFYSLGGTAHNGTDYQMLPGFVTIPAGSLTANVLVTPILDKDTSAETNETVVLQLHPLVDIPPGRLGLYSVGFPSNAVVTIAESTNPPPVAPVITVMATVTNASEVGPKPGIFTVTRTGSTTNQLKVYYSLGGTALNGVDYQPLPNSVSFPAGSNSVDITVMPILDVDPKPQTNDTVKLQLLLLVDPPLNHVGAYSLGWPSNAVINIAESPNQPSNPPPVVTIITRDPIASVGGNSGRTNNASFVVRRTDGTNADLVVYYAVGGTASNGVDYVTLPGSVTIPASRHTAVITVSPLDDQSSNLVETVVLTLQTPPVSGSALPTYAVGRPYKAAAVIVDRNLQGPASHPLQGGLFQLGLPVANGSWRVDMSTDLINWQPVSTSVVTGGTLQFVDPDAAGAPTRFYRAVPDPSAPPLDD